MGAKVQAICHGLAPCRSCHLPVAAPLGLLERELFHLSRCPHCHVANPHPREEAELAHTRRTAKVGAIVLIASLLAVLAAPLEMVWQGLDGLV
jgi:hypothetical protein